MPSEALFVAIAVAALGAAAGAVTAIINRRATVEAARLAAEPNLITSLTNRIDKLTERLDVADHDIDVMREQLVSVQNANFNLRADVANLRRQLVIRDGYIESLRAHIVKHSTVEPPALPPDFLEHIPTANPEP